jgi:hypothetical protein
MAYGYKKVIEEPQKFLLNVPRKVDTGYPDAFYGFHQFLLENPLRVTSQIHYSPVVRCNAMYNVILNYSRCFCGL